MINDAAYNQTVVDDAVETISKIANFDRETARDHYHFSIWVAAVATAGLGFLLTKGPDLVQDNPQLKRWIVAAAIGLLVALALSAIVQWCVGTFRESTQTIKGLYQHQRLRIICAPENIHEIMRTPETWYRLTAQLLNGEFIADELKGRWCGHHRRRDQARRIYLIALWVQWVVVALCYIAVLTIAFP